MHSLQSSPNISKYCQFDRIGGKPDEAEIVRELFVKPTNNEAIISLIVRLS